MSGWQCCEGILCLETITTLLTEKKILQNYDSTFKIQEFVAVLEVHLWVLKTSLLLHIVCTDYYWLCCCKNQEEQCINLQHKTHPGIGQKLKWELFFPPEFTDLKIEPKMLLDIFRKKNKKQMRYSILRPIMTPHLPGAALSPQTSGWKWLTTAVRPCASHFSLVGFTFRWTQQEH